MCQVCIYMTSLYSYVSSMYMYVSRLYINMVKGVANRIDTGKCQFWSTPTRAVQTCERSLNVVHSSTGRWFVCEKASAF